MAEELVLGQIVCAHLTEVGEERRIIIEAKVRPGMEQEAVVDRFLKELEAHGLTICLTVEEPQRPPPHGRNQGTGPRGVYHRKH